MSQQGEKYRKRSPRVSACLLRCFGSHFGKVAGHFYGRFIIYVVVTFSAWQSKFKYYNIAIASATYFSTSFRVQTMSDLLLNDKNGTIFNLKYRKGFLILVSGKGMEILFYFKPFLQKL